MGEVGIQTDPEKIWKKRERERERERESKEHCQCSEVGAAEQEGRVDRSKDRRREGGDKEGRGREEGRTA
jgi:hypothetical protein